MISAKKAFKRSTLANSDASFRLSEIGKLIKEESRCGLYRLQIPADTKKVREALLELGYSIEERECLVVKDGLVHDGTEWVVSWEHAGD